MYFCVPNKKSQYISDLRNSTSCRAFLDTNRILSKNCSNGFPGSIATISSVWWCTDIKRDTKSVCHRSSDTGNYGANETWKNISKTTRFICWNLAVSIIQKHVFRTLFSRFLQNRCDITFLPALWYQTWTRYKSTVTNFFTHSSRVSCFSGSVTSTLVRQWYQD